MKIQEFIKNQFVERLKSSPCLIIYDPERRYMDIALKLVEEGYKVINAGESTILGREEAVDEWLKLGKGKGEDKLVIYLPLSKPERDEEKRLDPYQIFSLGGAEFPDSDGDEYQALCKKAFPDYVGQVDVLFSAGPPDFATVNALEAGATWPKLKTLLKADSAREIIIALLSPSGAQQGTLKEDSSWHPELKSFLLSVLGLSLKTKSADITAVQNELWMYILFSEFALDLPGELPESLLSVTRADKKYEHLVFSVCDGLRNSEDNRDNYMEKAKKASRDLQLENKMKGIEEHGRRDTFSFENKSYLASCIQKIIDKDYLSAQEILNEKSKSIWAVNEGSHREIWTVAEKVLVLAKEIGDSTPLLDEPSINLSSLFSLYSSRFYRIDKLKRDFEYAVVDLSQEVELLEEVVDNSRKAYSAFADKMQQQFIGCIQSEGWPVIKEVRNTQVFDQFVAPLLKEKNNKIAFLMLDALRYELAMELLERFPDSYQVEHYPVCAQLPTITAVGMASLMPDADGKLTIEAADNTITPKIGSRSITNPTDRFNYIQTIYGDRCGLFNLEDLPKKKKKHLKDTVELLLIKSTEIDRLGEMNPGKAALFIQVLIKDILKGIDRLKKLGFKRIIIATDHGFMLQPEQEPGNVVPKPDGDWIVEKPRCLLGRGSANAGTIAFDTADVGIKADFPNYVVPKSLGTFQKGVLYFHQGLSLQECVLPLISIEIKDEKAEYAAQFTVTLDYKQGKTNTITSRRPMIAVSVIVDGLDFFPGLIQIQLEAYDLESGKTIGEPAACPELDSATKLLRLELGKAVKIPLKMKENFNSRRIAVDQKFYRENDRILQGGIWAEVTLCHNDIEDDDYAFYIEDMRPI